MVDATSDVFAGDVTAKDVVASDGSASDVVADVSDGGGPKDAALAVVQAIGLGVFGAPVSVMVQTASPQTKGDLNVVAVSWQGGGLVTSITDSDGNTYQIAVPSTSSVDLGHAIYYAKNIAGGGVPNTITVLTKSTEVDASAADPNVDVMEVAGLDTTAPFETMNQANGNNASMTSNNIVTTTPRSFLVASGVLDYGFSFADASASFTPVPLSGARAGDIIGYEIVQTAGTYNATVALANGSYWMLQLAAFK